MPIFNSFIPKRNCFIRRIQCLDQSRTRITRTYEIDVLSTDSVTEAGLALTGVMENNKQKARRSNGVDNTIFLGPSWGDYLGVGTTAPRVVKGKFGAADSGGAGFVQLPSWNCFFWCC